MAKGLHYNFLVDTNIYQSKGFDFVNDSALQYLKEHCMSGIIQLYSHKVIINECKAHIKEKVKGLKKLSKEIIKNISDDLSEEQKRIFKNAVEREANKNYNNSFDAFIKETNCIILSNERVDVDKIISDYFEKRPPFGTQGKKDEFPDAFVLESLFKYIETNNEKFVVVSNDHDWKDTVEGKENIILFDDIREAFNYIFDDVSEITNKIFENICDMENILEDVKHQILNKTINCDDFNSELEITNVYFDSASISIYDFNSTQVVLSILTQADIDYEGEVFDAENSPYDSEEKEYTEEIYEDISCREKVEIEFNIILDLNSNSYKLETKLDDKDFYFDGSTLYLS